MDRGKVPLCPETGTKFNVRDAAKQVMAIVAQLVFKGTGDHDSKIPIEREQVTLRRRGEVCGCVDGLVTRCNTEFINPVIALPRALELVEFLAFLASISNRTPGVWIAVL